MCGRFAQTRDAESLALAFDLQHLLPVHPSYNIAPGSIIAAVRTLAASPAPASHTAGPRARELAPLLWGLVPPWARDPLGGPRPFNARAETAAEKPTFRNALKSRRCLIPADGYYEWQKRGGRRQPFYFTARDGKGLALGALWERWMGADGSVIESCVVLTTAPNALAAPVHDRMPVIVAPQDYDAWLAPHPLGLVQGPALLQPYPAEAMDRWPVTPRVGDSRADDPLFVEPLLETNPGGASASETPPEPPEQPELF